MNFGVEFEMVIHYNDYEKKKKFLRLFEHHLGTVDDDGSIRPSYPKEYRIHETAELTTRKFNSFKKFREAIEKVFINPDGLTLSINKGGGDLMIEFNESTGTHIHFSTKQEVSKKDSRVKTIELDFLTPQIVNKMVKYIEDNTTFPEIKARYNRRYCVGRRYFEQKYSKINCSNNHGYGTMEFRMFNLTNIPQEKFISALFEQLHLMLKATLIAHNELLNSKNLRKNISLNLRAKAKKELKPVQRDLDYYNVRIREINDIIAKKKALIDLYTKKEVMKQKIDEEYNLILTESKKLIPVRKQLLGHNMVINKIIGGK